MSSSDPSPDGSKLTNTPYISANDSVRSKTGIEAHQINSVPSLPGIPDEATGSRNPRPAARMIRAIESTALSLEQIDSLFQL
jgi:hypothetical protein